MEQQGFTFLAVDPNEFLLLDDLSFALGLYVFVTVFAVLHLGLLYCNLNLIGRLRA